MATELARRGGCGFVGQQRTASDGPPGGEGILPSLCAARRIGSTADWAYAPVGASEGKMPLPPGARRLRSPFRLGVRAVFYGADSGGRRACPASLWLYLGAAKLPFEEGRL